MSNLNIASCAILILVVQYSSPAPVADLVTSLPSLLFAPKFKHYSGFLQTSPTHFLHYWFVESQNVPSTDPMLLWLNGGPGCSSLSGLLDELGPFKALGYGATLGENPFAWNKAANVLFLESPAGVGFSYSTDANITTDDYLVAAENHKALLQFFQKFPEYKSNDFFISGESYAGIYLPTLGSLLVQDGGNFPTFKGVLSGNGAHNFPLLYNTTTPFLYYHSLIDERLWNTLSTTCCNGNPYVCNYFGIINGIKNTCYNLTLEAMNVNPGLNYDLYYKCYIPTNTVKFNQETALLNILAKVAGINRPKFRGQESPTNGFSNSDALPRCAHYNDTTIYLNRADVRAALHIPTHLPAWSQCNYELNGKFYHVKVLDTTSYWHTILNAAKRVLVYNGDVDTVCNSVLNQQFTAQLGRALIAPKTLWRYENEVPSVAGFVTKYESLDYVTLRGAGHFVPSSSPRESLQMIINFMRNTGSYSLPTNINVKPAPLIHGHCTDIVPLVGFKTGPLPVSTLCGGNGECVNGTEASLAHCQCKPGWTGSFCQKISTPVSSSTVSMCAAYSTPQVISKAIPLTCGYGQTCVPFKPECMKRKLCTMPIGYCMPWVHISVNTRRMLHRLKRVHGRLETINMKNMTNVNKYDVQ